MPKALTLGKHDIDVIFALFPLPPASNLEDGLHDLGKLLLNIQEKKNCSLA